MTTDILEDGGITDDVRKTKRYKVFYKTVESAVIE